MDKTNAAIHFLVIGPMFGFFSVMYGVLAAESLFELFVCVRRFDFDRIIGVAIGTFAIITIFMVHVYISLISIWTTVGASIVAVASIASMITDKRIPPAPDK